MKQQRRGGKENLQNCLGEAKIKYGILNLDVRKIIKIIKIIKKNPVNSTCFSN